MADLLNVQRPPVLLRVALGSSVGLDPKARVVRFEATNDVLLDQYHIEIPLAMLKHLIGDVIAREAQNEAQQRAGAVTVPTLKIVRPS